ncbi:MULTISPECIES: electron transport complex subunit RsxC [Thiorhodovibrio]|uniref:electron transport complex subunit RsxC n=1 Tax=Thiorhodovibrio TaxID=61593 RepID=UPI0019115920|nr:MULTISPECIES: electron transport complex subunit RsxC [Thiorhodovibrio]MBK5969732.1 electron transport complex subunit RsxC [Thiorhodovibrio winogradskyi]WPL13782.1 Nitrogen fixation protein RnfC [Thiorhodovibrio litoralis]
MNTSSQPHTQASPGLASHPKVNPSQKLWKFHGGVHLPEEKDLSNQGPVVATAVPKRLVIPLAQHIGAPTRPCVKVGDRVFKGQMIGEPQGYVSAPVHASSSGVVTAIEQHAMPHPSGLPAPSVIIETDGEDAWASDLPEPVTDFHQLDADALRTRVRMAGIVGLGGASFPSSVKLNPGKDQPIDTLVLNGAECEPYITCDDMLMRDRAADIITGARIIVHLLGAERCLIGIEDNKPEAIAAMRAAVAEQQPQTSASIKVLVIPTLYPSGGEKQLIRILTGKEVPTHGIPAQIGVVCQNVGTVAAVADAVLRGHPLVERFVTVTGRGIAKPGNFRVRVGTLANELVAASGGYTGELAKLVAGGPMMGANLATDAVPITKATNCILALTPAESPDPGAATPCIRCGQCAQVCPANLLPQQLYWHARAKDLDKVQDYNLFDCIECGCCAHVCPAHIPLVQYYRYAKNESWAREREKRASEHAKKRHEAREARLERLDRERKAKLRKKKEAITPKTKTVPGKSASVGGAEKTAPAGAGETPIAGGGDDAGAQGTKQPADRQTETAGNAP